MKKVIFILLTAALLSSCGAYKRLGYFQDMQVDSLYKVTQKPETKVIIGDMLKINVLSTQPELAAPFNLKINVNEEARDGSDVDSENANTYTVDENGNILFPIFGEIHVEGLSLNEVASTIVDKIKEKNYIKDPFVSAEFKNFRVIGLGELGNSQVIDCPSGQLNILEFLAMSRDLTDQAQRNKLMVIRTDGDNRQVYSLNPKSKAIFDSPAFWLQRNDIVYAAPVNTKIDGRTNDMITAINTPVGILSTLLSVIIIFISFGK